MLMPSASSPPGAPPVRTHRPTPTPMNSAPAMAAASGICASCGGKDPDYRPVIVEEITHEVLSTNGVVTVTWDPAKMVLVGIERNAIGVPGDPVPVHVTLLGAKIGVLEGLELSDAPEGEAFLMAQPLKLAGCEGAPCRALLMI